MRPMTSVNILLPLRPLFLHQIGDPVILLRIQITKRDILHLPFDRRNPEPMRNRTENFQRLVRDPALAFFRLVFERAHIMQPVRQLDQNDADVLRHGDEHFAVILVLLLFLGPELDLLQLGQAVDEHGAVSPKFRDDLFKRDGRIFHDIMQEALQ